MKFDKVRFALLALVAAALAIPSVAIADGWFSDMDDTKEVALGDVLRSPRSYVDVDLKIKVYFGSTGESYNPYFTRFSEELYANFSAWPHDARLYDKRDWQRSYPLFFMSRVSKRWKNLQAIKRLTMVELRCSVREVFRGQAWIEIDDFAVLSEEGLSKDAVRSVIAGDAYYHAGRYDEAATHYGKATSSKVASSVRADIHRRLADARFRAGDFSGAHAEYKKALQAAPDSKVLRQNAAIAAAKAGNAEAEGDLAPSSKAVSENGVDDIIRLMEDPTEVEAEAAKWHLELAKRGELVRAERAAREAAEADAAAAAAAVNGESEASEDASEDSAEASADESAEDGDGTENAATPEGDESKNGNEGDAEATDGNSSDGCGEEAAAGENAAEGEKTQDGSDDASTDDGDDSDVEEVEGCGDGSSDDDDDVVADEESLDDGCASDESADDAADDTDGCASDESADDAADDTDGCASDESADDAADDTDGCASDDSADDAADDSDGCASDESADDAADDSDGCASDESADDVDDVIEVTDDNDSGNAADSSEDDASEDASDTDGAEKVEAAGDDSEEVNADASNTDATDASAKAADAANAAKDAAAKKALDEATAKEAKEATKVATAMKRIPRLPFFGCEEVSLEELRSIVEEIVRNPER